MRLKRAAAPLSILLSAAAALVFLSIPIDAAPSAPPASPLTPPAQLDAQFARTIKPMLDTYCISCHSGEKPQAQLNLSTFNNLAAVSKDHPRWAQIRDRLASHQMPPADAPEQPSAAARKQIIDWVNAVRKTDAHAHAGDPGIVLPRRLTNEEYNYTIRDLTGVDLQPTREFPADPSNSAGFDNSGESLVMSPSLLKKYLGAARNIADHMYLKPSGFGFSPSTMLAETDRDLFCVMQIINFYHRQNINYTDYFRAAWMYKNRAALGKPQASLAEIAADNNVSAKYLTTLWAALEEKKESIGPMAKLQELWSALPVPAAGQADAAEKGVTDMRNFVVKLRAKVEMRFLNVQVGGRGNGQGGGGQIPLLWKDIQYASHRLDFDRSQLQVEGEPPVKPLDVANEPNAAGEFGPGRTVPVINIQGDPDLAVPAGKRPEYEAAFASFCSIFPDKFYMQERGRNYFDTSKDRGRYLSAGFHSSMGYFRDDMPLHKLILDDKQQKELDEYWLEMDYVASVTARMYLQTVSNPSRQATTVPSAAIVDDDATSESKIKAAESRALAAVNGNAAGAEIIKGYYGLINSNLRAVDAAQKTALASHIDAVLDFAAKAFRRPLTKAEQDDLRAYYKSCREKDGLSHEDTIREMIVTVLMSPDLMYRVDLLSSAKGVHPLSDYDLASRLSYFLWSSIPDDELLAHAKAGDLHTPSVIAAQAKRMLKDPRSRALAVEFGGNWLEFRQFRQLTTVDQTRFTAFTKDLQTAMFEEPVQFLMDIFQNNRPILDCLYATDTFVNPALAKHYGIPVPKTDATVWTRITDANKYDRGGLLPMAVFLTKNAPGLRTSPVKRGNWVVKNILGEQIPPPPPNVPELPRDESKLDLPLREMLARHRADASCMSCHERIDSMGLVFEGFDPVGKQRDKDLAGRTVDVRATFPGGTEGAGLAGLRNYIKKDRQEEFIDNFCGKLLAYALNRSMILPDEALVEEMHKKLAANEYRFDTVIESIVTSPQFLTKRGNVQ